MELKVIRHKTSKEFFEGFYTDEQVGSYAYQLERMFEQGSAIEGDYFIVSDKDKPLLSLEIYRNNTRRLLEKMPMVTIGTDLKSKQFIEAMSLILEYLNEDIMYGYTPKLEISLREDHEFYSEFKDIINEFGYKTMAKTINYTVDPKIDHNFKLRSYNLKKFIEYEIDDRYEFISNSTYRDLYTDLPADKLYLDLLEEGYQSEKLWETIFSDGKMIGYILPVFSNGLKNSIEMIDYGLTYSNDTFQMIAINRLVEIAKDNDVDDLTINVNDSDTKFVDLANELKLVENHTTVKFIKA